MSHVSRLLSAITVGFALTAMQPAKADVADLANVPLGTVSVQVKPNILFILDDSGSMGWSWMPDELGYWDWWTGWTARSTLYGYWSSQCNGVAYNPNATYVPPKKADGTSYPNGTFTSAADDGFDPYSSTTDLTNRYYYTYSGTQTKLNWTFSTNGTVDTTTTFYRECMSTIGDTASPGYSRFARVNASSLTTTQKTNYANWYSYYRARYLTMRSAAGRAFAALDSNYRVGFTVISDTSVSSDSFLDVADFNSTQKSNFFNLLYSSTPSSSTPLLGALSKAGQYYGNVVSGQRQDPMQYSCQRNYAILSTDGYWNSVSSDYGPNKLDNSTQVGQQDGDEVRPMLDGALPVRTVRTEDPYNTTVVTTDSMTSTYGGTQWDVSSTTGANGCRSNRYSYRTRNASCAVDWTRTNTRVTSQVDWTETQSVNGVTLAGYPKSGTTNTTVSDNTVPAARPSCPTGNWQGTGGWSGYSCSSNPTGGAGFNGFVANNRVSDNLNSSDSQTTYDDPPATTTDTTTPQGGSSNSLADVAEYYYRTDLRTDLANTLKATGPDTATHQHMTTYTLGLGVKGTLSYDENYLNTPATGDYAALINGTKNWPIPSGTLGGSENATHVDDLWHAAVNGRGRYFSASDPDAVVNSLSKTLGEIQARNGSAAAAASSSMRPTPSDSWIFLPSYTTNSNASSWFGDLRAFKREFTGGTSGGKALAPDTTNGKELWSAKAKLEARSTARRVLFNSSGTLTAFTYANLTTAGLNTSFDNRCTTASPTYSQCGNLTTTAKAKVTGTNIVNFLVGDKSLYLNVTDADYRVFRTRNFVLGDIINSSPAYAAKPPFRYTDAGYASFVSANSTRSAMVYVGANDGMLHAFRVGLSLDNSGNVVQTADAGSEVWAFVPTAVIPNLWRLADRDYDADHRYFVDATPVIADVYDRANSRWRTILVSGLGKGGTGYFALDITDPDNPALLWEFSDAAMGYSYGNPVITKNAAGTWIVMFTSGINNTGVNGRGRLYIRNAMTGAAENTSDGYIETSAGSTSTPSNLTRIDAWIDSVTDNTTLRVYGGDMLGNLWRFDIDDRIAPSGKEATLLGIAQTSGGTRQPITTKPLLSEISVNGNRYAVVSFGTGRYLGINDLSDNTQQTIYSVKDALGAGIGVLSTTATSLLVQQTLNSSRGITTPASVDWATRNGWFINLPASTGERVVVDPVSSDTNSLTFSSVDPESDVCSPGGTSYIYDFNLLSGTIASVLTSNTMVVGLSVEQHPDGSRGTLATGLDGSITSNTKNPSGSSSGSPARRSSWRELVD